MYDREPLQEHELDVVGSCFGLRFIPGGAPDGLIELYVEDDENWLYKTTFNHFWLNDLEKVLIEAKNHFKMS